MKLSYLRRKLLKSCLLDNIQKNDFQQNDNEENILISILIY